MMPSALHAHVKRKAPPSLSLAEGPVPLRGIYDVLIRVQKTGIGGTDRPIYKGDAWAQRTIPVPMTNLWPHASGKGILDWTT